MSATKQKIEDLLHGPSAKQLLEAVADYLQEEIDTERYTAVDNDNFEKTRGRIRGLEGFHAKLTALTGKEKKS